MSTKGSRRSAGISLTTTQRTAGMSAACYNELPQHEPSAADGIDVNQPLEAIGAAEAENSAHEKAPFGDFHNSPLPEASPARDDLSSLSYERFPDREIYFPHLREGLINEPQTLAILPKMPPRPWHRPTAQRRAPTANRAQSERRLSRSRARARLCHSSHHSADRRRETLAMLCSLLC
jgi:hypothetical protein